MEEILHQRIVGQDAAISALARSVRRAQAELKDPKRPIGSFLFLGPSGVGKTESALALAEFLFGTEDAVVTLNMSEYMEKHNVARLIGAPPGYVGYDEGGQLTERVRQRPYAVVLVDGVEKAHPDVYDLFLQVLDQGQLKTAGALGLLPQHRDGDDLNLGTRGAGLPETLPPGEDPKEAVLAAVRDHFRPEFLNRLDGVIVFDPSSLALRQILDLMLDKLIRQLGEPGDHPGRYPPGPAGWLVDQHQEPAYGARPEPHPADPRQGRVSERLINGTLLPGQRITVEVEASPPSFAPAGRGPGGQVRPPRRCRGRRSPRGLRPRRRGCAWPTAADDGDGRADSAHGARPRPRRGSLPALDHQHRAPDPPEAWRRVVVRPVQLRGRRHLRFSYFDARQDVTKNYAGPAATPPPGGACCTSRSAPSRYSPPDLNMQITKSGKAIFPCLPPAGAAPLPHRRMSHQT